MVNCYVYIVVRCTMEAFATSYVYLSECENQSQNILIDSLENLW